MRCLKKEKQPLFPPLQRPSGLVYGDEAKAEVFADSLEEQFFPHLDLDADSEVERVANYT